MTVVSVVDLLRLKDETNTEKNEKKGSMASDGEPWTLSNLIIHSKCTRLQRHTGFKD